MLTYRIYNPQAVVKSPQSGYLTDEAKKMILARQLEHTIFHEGDRAVFKKPKRNRICGQIIHIEGEFSKCEWNLVSRVPNNISILTDAGKLITTSAKKLSFIRGKVK